jgi:hypothetical protein
MSVIRAGQTSTWKIVGAWVIVSLPFAWGIAQTVRAALGLLNR